ncbi:hypothetical protein Aros01_07768 [Streptosporangium roseum]
MESTVGTTAMIHMRRRVPLTLATLTRVLLTLVPLTRATLTLVTPGR